ncbi:MAG: AMP-binding protein [Opitutaceae bacterium]|nr:AMP-binding protein [Opitutaceae bacterium]
MDRAELTSLVRATGCAVERSGAIFLCDPQASAGERSQMENAMARTGEWGGHDQGWLGVRTGGTGGVVKFARHDQATLSAAAHGFGAHFGLGRVNAVDVLPPHHVSGLMARVRCAMTGGEHRAWDWKRLEAGDTPPPRAGDWVLSLVPTQLQRLLQAPRTVEWLRGLRIIFVGGGPVWPQLAEMAAEAGLRLSLGYGLTETAAMVAALRPEEFLAGARSCGAALPHARVSVDAGGAIRVAGESLFRGFWPEWREPGAFTTEDLGALDARGQLTILGRCDSMILTGGKKVSPAEVEAALRASGEFDDVAVIGLPDAEWGEAVVACFPVGRVPDTVRASAALAPHARPKKFVPLRDWPRTASGKIDRIALRALAEAGA